MSALERQAIAAVIARAEALGIPVPNEVRAFTTHTSGSNGAEAFAEANPDGEYAGCCIGEAHRGLAGCTCWIPVYDEDAAEPQPPQSVADLTVRDSRCGDCAYRRGSPELADKWLREELMALPQRGEPFWCHDGMRRPTAWVHPTHGRIPGAPDDWHPRMVGNLPFRANGRPALLCAGWAAIATRTATGGTSC